MEISIYDHWIKSGSNYQQAVLLYNEHGKNETLKKLFNKAETPYTRSKIAWEIKALSHIMVPLSLIEIPAEFKTFTAPKIKIDAALLPDQLKAEYYKLGPLIGRIRFLHSRLDIIQSDEIRKEHAFEIIESVALRRQIFNKIDYFTQHGTLMPELNKTQQEAAAEAPKDELKEVKVYRLKEERQKLRVQRSKLKNLPHRQADLNRVIERLAEIEKELANDII